MSVQDLETVTCESADGVAWVTLNRPDSMNAWTRQLGEELLTAVQNAAEDAEARVIVLAGAGRAFSSGADLKDDGLRTADGGYDVLTPLRDVFNPAILRVRTVGKPVIAAVNGPAVGIGCSLALAADLVVAARSAYFLLAFVNIGLGLDGGASQSLLTRVGHARAMEMAMLGERVDAETAERWGLANRAVDDEQLRPTVDELAAKLAAGPLGSYATIKRTINERSFHGFAELLDLEAVAQQERAESGDFAEGVASFQERRAPTFTGA